MKQLCKKCYFEMFLRSVFINFKNNFNVEVVGQISWE